MKFSVEIDKGTIEKLRDFWDDSDQLTDLEMIKSLFFVEGPYGTLDIMDEVWITQELEEISEKEEESQQCTMEEDVICHGCGDREKETLIVAPDEYQRFKEYYSAYKVGSKFKCDVGAPGIGFIFYKITRSSEEEGLWGNLEENCVRELEPWEVI